MLTLRRWNPNPAFRTFRSHRHLVVTSSRLQDKEDACYSVSPLLDPLEGNKLYLAIAPASFEILAVALEKFRILILDTSDTDSCGKGQTSPAHPPSFPATPISRLFYMADIIIHHLDLVDHEVRKGKR